MQKKQKEPSRISTKKSSISSSSKKKTSGSKPVKDQFYIVGMGGSAGSLEAFRAVLPQYAWRQRSCFCPDIASRSNTKRHDA